MTPSTTEIDIDNILSNLPKTLKDELISAYNLIIKNYREGRWEPAELNGGKLCEVVYSILDGYIKGTFPSTSSKPRNMVDACRLLEQAPSSFSRSVRIQIPRMIIALYEVRNNRGVGHAGGDIDPNKMDATCVLYMSKWILAELVRLFHAVDIKTAENSINLLVDRTLPVVWVVGENLRILDTKITMKEKTLLLLYHKQSSNPVSENDLVNWVEHSNASVYRRDVLRALHKEKLIEYDEGKKIVYLSPMGSLMVEKEIFPKINLNY